jgi:hypothetical protein
MSKFFTSVFLIAAMLVSGLSSFTSSIPASAAVGLSDPIECAAPGLFKNREVEKSPCQPCPVDFYCRNDMTKKDSNGEEKSRTPELPGVNGIRNSEVVACPNGTTTKGHTKFPFANRYQITKDDQNAKLGEFAYEIADCAPLDFKCANDEVEIKLNNKKACSKSCPANEALVVTESGRDCFLKCRDGLSPLTSGCAIECKIGEILKPTGKIINGKIETSCVSECLVTGIVGQVLVNGICVCPDISSTNLDNVQSNKIVGNGQTVIQTTILDGPNSSTGKCGVPIKCTITGQIKAADGNCFCPSPTILNDTKTSCDTPPTLCPANTFGASQPSCSPCPSTSTSLQGGAKSAGDCRCPIQSQIILNNLCACISPSVLNPTGTGCEIPVVLCGANFYGTSQPNCMACPINFTSVAGKALTVKDCKAAACEISGQLRYLDGVCYCPIQSSAGVVVAADGSKKCSTCPANTTSVVIGQETNGQNQIRCDAIIPVTTQENNGGGGLCGGWWLAACIGGAVGVACLVNIFGLCKGSEQKKEPVYSTTDYNFPTTQPTASQGGRAPVLRRETYQTAGGKCTDTSSNYINQVVSEAKSLPQAEGTTRIEGKYEGQWHKDSSGQYTWIKTDSSGNKATSFSTTIINSQYSANNALQCLMVRYAAMINEPFGSSNYVKNLKSNDILHGFNKRVKAECLNLTKLLSTLEALGYADSSQISKTVYKYAVYKNGQKVTQSYSTEQEAKNEYRNSNPSNSSYNSNKTYNNSYNNINGTNTNYTTSYNNDYTVNDYNNSNTVTVGNDIKINTGNTDYGNNPFNTPEGFLDILQPIKTFAVFSDPIEGDSVHNMDDMDDTNYSLASASEPSVGADETEKLTGTEEIGPLEGYGEDDGIYGNEGLFASSNNNDLIDSATSGTYLAEDLYDTNGQIKTTVYAFAGDNTIASNFASSCSSIGSFNPINIFATPIKVNALVVDGALNGTGTVTQTNESSIKIDCSDPVSLFADSGSFSFSNNVFGDIAGENGIVDFSEFDNAITDSSLSFKIDNPNIGAVEGITNDGANNSSVDCGFLDFTCSDKKYQNADNTTFSTNDSTFGPSNSNNNYSYDKVDTDSYDGQKCQYDSTNEISPWSGSRGIAYGNYGDCVQGENLIKNNPTKSIKQDSTCKYDVDTEQWSGFNYSTYFSFEDCKSAQNSNVDTTDSYSNPANTKSTLKCFKDNGCGDTPTSVFSNDQTNIAYGNGQSNVQDSLSLQGGNDTSYGDQSYNTNNVDYGNYDDYNS